MARTVREAHRLHRRVERGGRRRLRLARHAIPDAFLSVVYCMLVRVFRVALLLLVVPPKAGFIA